MYFKLYCEPKQPPMLWDDFCATKPSYSIALDGYVIGKPQFVHYIIIKGKRKGPFANFNHHEGVERLETRATCAQVLMDMREGLYQAFKKDGYPRANVYVNDCDEDVCLSVFLLHRPDLVEHVDDGTSRFEKFLKLIDTEDKLDTTAGSYPFSRCNLGTLEEMAWIFEPYRQFRISGEIDRDKTPEAYKEIILAVEKRLEQFLAGDGKTVKLDLNYEVLDHITDQKLTTPWVMIKEIGAQAYLGMFSDKHEAFVSVRELPNNRWKYSVGCKSKFIPFNVPEILAALDKAENNPNEHWGGGNTIGGSPRISGSVLTPKQVKTIINKTLRANL